MKTTTALTGFIVPKCKIYGNGFFSEKPNDPDEFSKLINELKKSLYNSAIEAQKDEINLLKQNEYQKYYKIPLEIRDGLIVIHRKIDLLKDNSTNRIIISARNPTDPDYQKSYIDKNGNRVNLDHRVIIKRRVKESIGANGLYRIKKSRFSK